MAQGIRRDWLTWVNAEADLLSTSCLFADKSFRDIDTHYNTLKKHSCLRFHSLHPLNRAMCYSPLFLFTAQLLGHAR